MRVRVRQAPRRMPSRRLGSAPAPCPHPTRPRSTASRMISRTSTMEAPAALPSVRRPVVRFTKDKPDKPDALGLGKPDKPDVTGRETGRLQGQ